MGVRLYPKSDDPAVLEKMIGVPAGTHQRLEELKTKHKADLKALQDGTLDREISEYDLEYEQYCEISDDPDLGPMNRFLIYGWGKLQRPTPGGADDYCGEIPPESTVMYLMAQSVYDIDVVKLVQQTGGLIYN